MSKRKRIAICVSGQTRHINEDPPYNTQEFLKVLDLFSDYDYDLFGHTWSDHEDPNDTILSKFTEYRSDDQEIIWDTIIDPSQTNGYWHPHWWQFVDWKADWVYKEKYINLLNGKSDENFIEFAKERMNGTIGQVWSAHESILLTKNYRTNQPGGHGYPLVVKLRWDLKVKDYPTEVFKDVLYNFTHQIKEYDPKNYVNRTTSPPTWLATNDVTYDKRRGICFNDFIFAFNGHDDGIFFNHSPVQLLSELINSHQRARLPYVLPSAHTLWIEWITNAGFIISPVLPNIIGLTPPNPNKEWGYK